MSRKGTNSSRDLSRETVYREPLFWGYFSRRVGAIRLGVPTTGSVNQQEDMRLIGIQEILILLSDLLSL